MDNVTLKKKLSTYLTDGGRLKNVSDEVLYEVIVAWENWTGPSAEFYRSLGFTYKQMAGLVGKAKKLKRQGHFGASDFKSVTVEGLAASVVGDQSPCPGAEIVWTNGRVIRFSQVDLLLDFLKKSA